MSARIPVLVRRARWAVVAKPARLACHRSAMVRDRQTVVKVLRRRFGPSVHLVHRLDRPVSGCLLVAFDPETKAMLQAALTDADAHKTYIAMVRGYFRWDDPVPVDTQVKKANGTPVDAASEVRVLGRSHDPRCSLVAVTPFTGRYHQVRRHVRDLNHPILGDTSHGDSRENKRWVAEHGLTRLALHCLSLDLPLPDGDRLDVWCPPPADLVYLWKQMPWWDDAVAAEPRLAFPPLPLLAHGD